MKPKYEKDLNLLSYPPAQTVEDMEVIFWNIVEQSKCMSSDSFVWVMVSEGMRRDYIKAFRAFLKFNGLSKRIENTVKIVEEERA